MILDADALKNANLDILYGDDTLYAGQQLRIPLHTCYPDEVSDCHTVKSANETLELIASNYSTTAQKLCASNHAVFGNSYCDIKPLPRVNLGMELSVPRRFPTAPKPCKEIPGHWNCSTVEAGDTVAMVAIQFQVDLQLLMEANWGTHPMRCKDCTKCGSPSPDCLKIGQVLAVPVQDEELLRWCSQSAYYVRNPKYDCATQNLLRVQQNPESAIDASVTMDLSWPACAAAIGNTTSGSCTVAWISGDDERPNSVSCTIGSDTVYPLDKCRKNWLRFVSGTTFPLKGNLEIMEFPSLAVDFFCQANRRSIASCRNPGSLQEIPAVLPLQGPFKLPHVVW
jgi:hypothetical protein